MTKAGDSLMRSESGGGINEERFDALVEDPRTEELPTEDKSVDSNADEESGDWNIPEDDLDILMFSLFESLIGSSTTKSLRSFIANDKSCNISVSFSSTRLKVSLKMVKWANTQLRCAWRLRSTISLK